MKEIKPLLKGQVFGKLTVICLNEEKSKEKGEPYYVCICHCEPGKRVKILSVRKYSLTRKKHIKSCGCENAIKNSFIPNRELVLKNKIYRKYQDRHINELKDNINTFIKFKDFANMLDNSCNYCGEMGSSYLKDKTTDFILYYNGLDRIDNMLGYRTKNVLTACKICNPARGEMSVQEFKDYIIRLHNYQSRK